MSFCVKAGNKNGFRHNNHHTFYGAVRIVLIPFTARRPRVFSTPGLLFHVIVRGKQCRGITSAGVRGYASGEAAKYLGHDHANISTMLPRLSARQTGRT